MALAALLEQALLLAIPVALGRGFALVGDLLALGDADLQLRDSLVVEVKDKGDKGQALALRGVPEIGKLFARDKQLAAAAFLVAEHLGLFVGGDVAVDEPQLSIVDGGIAFGDVGAALAEGLNLGTFQDDAAFDVILDGIVEAGAAVFGGHAVVRIGFALLCHDALTYGRAGPGASQCGGSGGAARHTDKPPGVCYCRGQITPLIHMSAKSDDSRDVAQGADIFDVSIFIENDRMTIRILSFAVVFLLAAGVGLLIASQQTWFPLPEVFATSASTISGVTLAAAGAVPLSQIRNRMEKIRILKKIRTDYDALCALGKPDHEDLLFLREQIRSIYGMRLSA